jgi:spermidine/putrescine-binding protein
VTELQNGDAEIVFGWAYDMQAAEEEGLENITYFLPEEGTMIWMDNMVIPANSPNKYTAELFLNFIMRPEIAAKISNEVYVAVPNEGAYAYIEPEILNNPLIFPTSAELENAEFYVSIAPEAQAAYDEIWSRFSMGIE